jgi:ABC-2 type transport system ATP-binding protein
MILVENLSRHFGSIKAVDGISFSVPRGEVLGFLGPNGAGKSTSMRMIAGVLGLSAGSVKICGHDIVGARLAAQRSFGYLPEGAPSYGEMTPSNFLRFIGQVRGLKGPALARAVEAAVEATELGSVLEQQIDTLSKGFRRRVGLAQAILSDPPVLILDEPTDGLDPNQKHAARSLIRRMSADKAILISTHLLDEVDAVCTRALIIDQGRIVADGTPATLSARAASGRLEDLFRQLTHDDTDETAMVGT